MKKINLFFLLLFFLFVHNSSFASTETIHFNIILFGDKIGDMTVSREEENDGSEFYVLETKSKAKLLWIDKDNYSRYEVTFKNGMLFSSVFKEIENGKVQRWNNIQWDGSKYVVDGYKGKRTFTEKPTYSIVMVYFKDIRNIKRIFYEAEADFNDLEHPEPNTWEFKSSDGHRNVYYFENNKIKSMEFHVSIATVKMVRTN